MENPDEDLMYSSLSKIQGEKDAKRERRPTEEKSDKKQVKKAKIVTF